MGIKNAKLRQVFQALTGIANGPGSARLKYAANLNRTLIEDHIMALEAVRTDPVEGEEEWEAFRKATILENCRRDEQNNPIMINGACQFDNNANFQAKLDALQQEKFPQVAKAQQKRADEFEKLLQEEVEISDFPYRIKWSFIDMDERNDLIGITGEQQFILMSAKMFDGDPPWLEDDSTPDTSKKGPQPVPDAEEVEG